ncbi:hypothetical protein ABT294_21295 [Nonomuraea sp. NPDC000554]
MTDDPTPRWEEHDTTVTASDKATRLVRIAAENINAHAAQRVRAGEGQ